MIKEKRYWNTLIAAVVLLVLCSTHHVSATEEVSLDRALEQFYRNNYDVLINKYETDKAEADFVGAKLIPNPTLTYNYIGLELHNFPDSGDNTQMTVRLDQLIELGGKRGLRTEAAWETMEAAKLSHRDTVRTLLSGFYTLSYNLKLDLLNVDLAKGELARFDRVLEIAEKRLSAGHLSLVDYTKIKLSRIDLENSLTAAETQLKNDVEQFRFLIGSDSPLLPAVQLRESFPSYQEEGVIAAAYENRYDLLALERQQKAAAYNSSLAKAGRIPDITIGAEYDMFTREYSSTVGFGFSLPLPLFNQNQGDVLRRSAEAKQIDLQVEKVKKQIVVDVRQAMNNFAAAVKTFDAYSMRKAETEELLKRSEKAFTLGGITALDLIDTQKTHVNFMIKYNQALVQSNLAEQLIKVATGEIK
jgi:cobalt-zinc-cadmium efflux system outer membrane protein